MPGMTIVAKVRPGKRDEFLQVVCSLGNGGENHDGLKRFTVSEGIGEQTGFSVIYEWDT